MLYLFIGLDFITSALFPKEQGQEVLKVKINSLCHPIHNRCDIKDSLKQKKRFMYNFNY